MLQIELTKAKLMIRAKPHYEKLMCRAHAGLNLNIQFMEPIRPHVNQYSLTNLAQHMDFL